MFARLFLRVLPVGSSEKKESRAVLLPCGVRSVWCGREKMAGLLFTSIRSSSASTLLSGRAMSTVVGLG